MFKYCNMEALTELRNVNLWVMRSLNIYERISNYHPIKLDKGASPYLVFRFQFA